MSKHKAGGSAIYHRQQYRGVMAANGESLLINNGSASACGGVAWRIMAKIQWHQPSAS